MRSITAAFIALLVLTTSMFAADWPQWRGPNRDGVVTGAVTPETWPKQLKEEWKVTVGVGHSSPVVVKDKVYVFARQGEEELLLCLDVATGKEIWRSANPVSYDMHPAARSHGKGPKSTPVIALGNVYTFGISGVLSCHDALSGKLKWRHEFSKQYPNTSPLYGTAMSPVVDNGLLIAHAGGQDKGALTAFDAQSGAVKWSNDADGPAYSSPIIATLAGARQIITFMQKDFVGVDVVSGKTLWRLPARSQYDTNSVTALIYKEMIIFAREGQGLTAVRLVKKDGTITPEEVWNNKESELYLSTPVIAGNILYGLSTRRKGQFFALDAETGKTVWQSEGRAGENAAILNLGKVLLLLTTDANLMVLPANSKEYAPLARYTVASSPTWAHPAVIGNRILIKDENTLTSLLIG